MSAINIIPGPDAVHILTDAAVYGPDGYLLAFDDKCHVTANRRLAVAGRGNHFFVPIVVEMLSERGWTIDDIYHDQGRLLDAVYEGTRGQMLERTGKAFNDLFFVGWSDEQSQRIVATWSSFQEPRFKAGPKLLIMAPSVSPEVIERAKAIAEHTSPDDFYGVTAVEVMKEQRYDKGDPALGGGKKHSVGGWILRTDVTREGITQRVVHEWPEDRVGERIVPKPRAAVLVAPNVLPLVPMSRLQRRQAEKLARKKGHAA